MLVINECHLQKRCLTSIWTTLCNLEHIRGYASSVSLRRSWLRHQDTIILFSCKIFFIRVSNKYNERVCFKPFQLLNINSEYDNLKYTYVLCFTVFKDLVVFHTFTYIEMHHHIETLIKHDHILIISLFLF